MRDLLDNNELLFGFSRASNSVSVTVNNLRLAGYWDFDDDLYPKAPRPMRLCRMLTGEATLDEMAVTVIGPETQPQTKLQFRAFSFDDWEDLRSYWKPRFENRARSLDGGNEDGDDSARILQFLSNVFTRFDEYPATAQIAFDHETNNANLNCYVPRLILSALVADLNAGKVAALQIMFEMAAGFEEYSTALSDYHSFSESNPLGILDSKYHDFTGLGWVTRFFWSERAGVWNSGHASQITFSNLTFDKTSQLGQIASELAESQIDWYRRNPREPQEWSEDIWRAELIIEELRLSRHYPHRKISEYLSAIADEDDSTKKKLMDEFDNVWTHRDLLAAIHRGHLSDVLSEKHHGVGNFESAADVYLKHKGFSSPSLEFVLVDAFLTNTFVSAMAPGSHWLTSNGFRDAAKRDAKRAAKFIFFEGGFVLLGFLAAAFLDPDRAHGFWTIFSTLVAIRWIGFKSGLNPFGAATKARTNDKLLADIALIQMRVSSERFNATLVRELLYALQARGAQLDRYPAVDQRVYDLLDKRIENESRSRH